MRAGCFVARGLAVALLVLPVLTAGAAAAQYRDFTGKVDKIEKNALIIDNRMGDKLQFERVETTRIVDERNAKKKKASWQDLALGDWVTIHWKMMDKPRKAYEVIVLPPRSEAGSDL
jgi:hypothetical protein